MYAIRSYYDDAVDCKVSTTLEVSFPSLISNSVGLSRMLHQTNLRKAKFNLPAYEVAGFKHLFIRVTDLSFTLIHHIISGWSLFLQVLVDSKFPGINFIVITSYSIHYTKLYDWIWFASCRRKAGFLRIDYKEARITFIPGKLWIPPVPGEKMYSLK